MMHSRPPHPTPSRRPRPRRRLRHAALVVAALTLGFGAVAVAKTVWVKARHASVRAGKSSRSPRLEQVGRGAQLHVLADEGGFLKVRTTRGKEGYVPRRWVTNKQPKKGKRMAALGRAARSEKTGGVSVTAGARGLAPEAETWAGGTAGMAEAAAAVKRLEARAPAVERVERFLEAGNLGPWKQAAQTGTGEVKP